MGFCCFAESVNKRMYTESYEHGEHQKYRPPPHVAKALIAHSIRHIPGKDKILEKCYPKKMSYHQGLKQHKHNDGGKLQWAYMN